MITQEQLRQIRRRAHEAEHGDTQEKVNARQSYAQDVKALLEAMEENGIALAIQRIGELETEAARSRRQEVAECLPAGPMPRKQPRLDFSKVQPDSGKMAAAGKDG